MPAKPRKEAGKLHILFADDETIIRRQVRSELEHLGHSVAVCPDGFTAVAALQKESFDCLIVDLNMPGMNGIEVIGHARQLRPNVEAIVMTGKPSQETAIAALRYEAFEYLQKPVNFDVIADLLERVAQRREMKQQLAALQHRLHRAEGDQQMVGNGPKMKAVRKLISKVAPTDSTVLVLSLIHI